MYLCVVKKKDASIDAKHKINLTYFTPFFRVSIVDFEHIFMMRCAIWPHLYNLKNVENTHGTVLPLVKLQASACKFTKSNTPPRLFFTFLKFYKWQQIVQCIIFVCWTYK